MSLITNHCIYYYSIFTCNRLFGFLWHQRDSFPGDYGYEHADEKTQI